VNACEAWFWFTHLAMSLCNLIFFIYYVLFKYIIKLFGIQIENKQNNAIQATIEVVFSLQLFSIVANFL